MFRRKDGNRELHKRSFAFKADPVTEEGRFSGYASVFGVLDSYREIVAKGAFVESLKRLKANGRTLPALWAHQSTEPIGGYDVVKEDEHGLYVEGFLLKDDVPRARSTYALMKANVVTGLSIGYYVLDESWNEKERVLTLKELDLVEVSLVTNPANDEARVDQVKAKLARGMLPTLREFETSLREQGFSKTQATEIANRGLKGMLDRGELGSGYGEVLKSLRESEGFTLPSFSRN